MTSSGTPNSLASIKGAKRCSPPLNILFGVALILIFLSFPAGLGSNVQNNPTETLLASADLGEPSNLLSSIAPTQSIEPGHNTAGLTPAEHDRLIVQLAALNSDIRTAVVLLDLSSGEEILSFNGDETFTAASTYKLFTVSDIYQRFESRSEATTKYQGYLPLDECIELTILFSENDCIEEWLLEQGHDASTLLAQRSGAVNTVFEPYDIRTTASDLAQLLQELYEGNLLSPAHTAELLELMKHQVWRDGIPAGVSNNIQVANKPGWLEDITNDAAILYTSEGDFALVILSEANSFDYIAEVTETISGLLQK